ncbi:hypothetical protein F7Q92_07575 [Ideonella dechloratans]|uniref:Uncharacterized protein n=1 Tax=Ideonella dechloratans TaxID=36863 RepID=A0A643FEZ7_IDEDE|nr:hypothetical protein [Ideonella dechloratans]KAB0583529.1 hypothetical protein F7Q92_07575 [Ideonella dechloratans]UFU09058.1 hypothetical protein LRM40_12135 [Ideonella dechloratans]
MEQLSRNGVDAALYDPADTTSPVEVLVLSKRYDAASLEHALQLRSRHGTRVVLDLCDNHFYAADPSPKWVERSDRLRAAARAANLVVASTEALAEVIRAEAGSAVRIAVIGDAAEPPLEGDSRSRWRHPLHEWHLHHTLRCLAR